MAATQVEIVSPASVLFEGEAEMVVCRSADGEIAFLADHVPFLGALDPCVVRIVGAATGGGGAGDEIRVGVTGGFVEVRDNRVIILADTAALGTEVDVDGTRTAAREAEGRLRDNPEDAAAQADLRRAEVLLEAAGAGGRPGD